MFVGGVGGASRYSLIAVALIHNFGHSANELTIMLGDFSLGLPNMKVAAAANPIL